jgi:hypothetical protein
MGNLVTAWSYSRYADYKQCPARFKYKHIDKIADPGGPAMARGSAIHKEGEDFLKLSLAHPGGRKAIPPKSFAYFKSEMQQLATMRPLVEQQWGFTRDWQPTGWFGKDTWLRVVCDVAIVYDDNTAEVIDFKTGKKYDTNEEQIELFSFGGFMQWPEVEHVTARLWYLDIPDGPNDGDPHPESTTNTTIREYTRDQFEAGRKAWEKKITPMFNDVKFAPRPNEKCRWCPYSKAKGGPCKF